MAHLETTPGAHDRGDRSEADVVVTLVVTDPDGGTQTLEMTIPSGPTKVPDLKVELGVPPEASLWVVRPSGEPTQLVDHARHNVKAGDRFETVVKGGVS
jgi:hypothetical protein